MSATLGEKLVTGDEEAPPAVVAKPDDAPPTIAAETDELSNDEGRSGGGKRRRYQVAPWLRR